MKSKIYLLFFLFFSNLVQAQPWTLFATVSFTKYLHVGTPPANWQGFVNNASISYVNPNNQMMDFHNCRYRIKSDLPNHISITFNPFVGSPKPDDALTSKTIYYELNQYGHAGPNSWSATFDLDPYGKSLTFSRNSGNFSISFTLPTNSIPGLPTNSIPGTYVFASPLLLIQQSCSQATTMQMQQK